MKRDINRFVEAQEKSFSGYAQALSEIKAGRKVGHWIWYIFPQLRGLGRSSYADFYGIEDRAEAEQYLAHEVLGARIREITEALLVYKGRRALDILGSVDAMKVQSSMTMFDCISPNDVFGEVLDCFYGGTRCRFTQNAMQSDVVLSSWNSKVDFLDEYVLLMDKVKRGDSYSYLGVKNLRAKEFQNTIKLVDNGFYYTEEGDRVVFSGEERMMANTRFYSTAFSVQDIEPQIEQTIVEVVNADCLDEGLRLLNIGYNPAILNMASRQNPGGGVISGAGAQEETIFRRSNIFRSLYQFASYAGQYGLPKSNSQYPLDRNFGGVYSPCVTVFRDNEKSGYKLLSNPYEVAFISVAGMNRPALTKDGMIVDSLVEPIKHKIRTIFRIGLKHRHDALVLGALGCGAFCNPPRHIARLFHEVMDEIEFKNKFKYIVFAILEDHNSHKTHNLEGNFLPFKEEFQ